MNSVSPVDRDIPVDHQHLLHLAIKVRVALLKVVANLVGLDVVVVEDAPDRTLASLGQPRKTIAERLLADKPRQRRNRPQLGRQAMVLGHGARHADHPSLGLVADLGLVRTVVFVLQPGLHAGGQRLVHAAVDHRAAEPQPTLEFGDRDAVGVAKHHLGPLHLPRLRRSRCREFFERASHLRRQHQRRSFGFPGHDHLQEWKKGHGKYSLVRKRNDGTNY